MQAQENKISSIPCAAFVATTKNFVLLPSQLSRHIPAQQKEFIAFEPINQKDEHFFVATNTAHGRLLPIVISSNILFLIFVVGF